MSRDDEEGFLGRWSKRKRQSVRAAPEPAMPPEPELPAPQETAPEHETDAEILARLDLPDPDTLEPGDDFSRYLKAPLPLHLKRRALRRLWVSNPVLANLDGLNDYDTDFTGDTVAPGMLKTAYKVGRGFLDHVVEKPESDTVEHAAVEPSEEATVTAGIAQDAAAEPEPRPMTADTATEPPDGLQEIQNSDGAAEDAQDFAAVRTNRRMAFRFDG